MLSHILPPALSLLVILGFAAVVGLLFLVVNTVALKMSGWKKIAERFPMRDAHFTSDSYRKRQGAVGKIGSGKRGFFDIRLAVEGVCVYPLFARRNPCLVPWSAIRRVSISASSLLVVADYERTFEFFLPAESLPALQARLASSLFHNSTSPFEAAKKAIQDGTQSRWMSAIAGQAVRFAQKQIEEERQSKN
jgi:hypothetical protein